MKRKILSMLLCIAVCVAMLPMTAYAAASAGTPYNITVAGVQVTSENADEITGVGINGSVFFEAKTRTLTLKNAAITGKLEILSGSAATIVLIGKNTIQVDNKSYGIQSTPSLTIKGDGTGSLSVVASYASGTTGSTGIYCQSGDIFFENVIVDAFGAGSGIYAENGKITLQQSKVSAKRGSRDARYSAFYAKKFIIAEDASLENAYESETFKSGEKDRLVEANSPDEEIGYVTIDTQFEDYHLKLFDGLKVTSRNVHDIPDSFKKSGTNGLGTFSYNPERSTLTLKDAMNNYGISHGQQSALVESGAPLTISLSGKQNRLLNSGDTGIILAEEDLTITGNTADSLEVKSARGIGINCKKGLDVQGGTITAIGQTHAIESASITVGGTIKATNDPGYGDIVIKAAEPIKAADGMMLQLTNCKEITPGEVEITNRAESGDRFAEISASKPENGEAHTHAYDSAKWNRNEKLHWRACTAEGCDQLDAAPHEFGAWTEAEPATQTEKGIKARTCSTCGYAETADIPAGSTVYGIEINEQNFPDEAFMNVVKKFDEDRNDYLSEEEISKVEEINCRDQNISSLDGIKYFTALTTLHCDGNQLTTLDVSQNTELQFLYCEENKLASLDVSKNKMLETLHCHSNQLASLDVSGNEKLMHFHCNENRLTSLDVSNNVGLKVLNCSENQLTTLDVGTNTQLYSLFCNENRLTSLDVSKNVKLTELNCSGNVYPISITAARAFNLLSLPGFDVSKASSWVGGKVSGNILTVDKDADQVTYTYDCGNNKTFTFTLSVDTVEEISGGSYTPVQKPEIQPVSGGKTELSKDGSTLEITPDEGMEIGTVTVNGKEVTVKDGKITGLKTGDKVQVTFIAKAPSKAEADQNAAAMVKDLKLTVKTSRTANKNIKATVQMNSELAAAVKELKAAGYKVQYKFYRSTKKASAYERMLIKDAPRYVNTIGDKDTYYYYKVRLAVYDQDGKLIAQTALKQCKAGSRIWVK